MLAVLLNRREDLFESFAEKTASTKQLWIRVLRGDASLPLPRRAMSCADFEAWAMRVHSDAGKPLVIAPSRLEGDQAWAFELGPFVMVRGAGDGISEVTMVSSGEVAQLPRLVLFSGFLKTCRVKFPESVEHACLHDITEGSDLYVYLRFSAAKASV